MDLCFGFDTPAPCHTARAADSSATRIPPGQTSELTSEASESSSKASEVSSEASERRCKDSQFHSEALDLNCEALEPSSEGGLGPENFQALGT